MRKFRLIPDVGISHPKIETVSFSGSRGFSRADFTDNGRNEFVMQEDRVRFRTHVAASVAAKRAGYCWKIFLGTFPNVNEYLSRFLPPTISHTSRVITRRLFALGTAFQRAARTLWFAAYKFRATLGKSTIRVDAVRRTLASSFSFILPNFRAG